jgi:UDPglucose 6-dehydrogenase
MQTNKIGIIGNGFVGNALYLNFKDKYTTSVYDKDLNRSINTYEETINSNIIFVCLPTPMKSAEGGECNLSIIEGFFKSLPKNLDGLFVIKSTVPVGTTKRVQELRSDLKIAHNPEFLTAINAASDFKNSYRNIVGGKPEEIQPLLSLMQDMFPQATNYVVDSNESEMIKYFANTYLATKVAYFNMIYDMCNKLDANYRNVIEGVCSDTRIGFSHTSVPGYDGDRGFGGTCFPKDINALIKTYENLNLDCGILKEVWEYNKKIRSNWDWSNNISATLSE